MLLGLPRGISFIFFRMIFVEIHGVSDMSNEKRRNMFKYMEVDTYKRITQTADHSLSKCFMNNLYQELQYSYAKSIHSYTSSHYNKVSNTADRLFHICKNCTSVFCTDKSLELSAIASTRPEWSSGCKVGFV